MTWQFPVFYFQCDGTLLATGSYDGYARLWSTDGRPANTCYFCPWLCIHHLLLHVSCFHKYMLLLSLAVYTSSLLHHNFTNTCYFCRWLCTHHLFCIIISQVHVTFVLGCVHTRHLFLRRDFTNTCNFCPWLCTHVVSSCTDFTNNCYFCP